MNAAAIKAAVTNLVLRHLKQMGLHLLWICKCRLSPALRESCTSQLPANTIAGGSNARQQRTHSWHGMAGTSFGGVGWGFNRLNFVSLLCYLWALYLQAGYADATKNFIVPLSVYIYIYIYVTIKSFRWTERERERKGGKRAKEKGTKQRLYREKDGEWWLYQRVFAYKKRSDKLGLFFFWCFAGWEEWWKYIKWWEAEIG